MPLSVVVCEYLSLKHTVRLFYTHNCIAAARRVSYYHVGSTSLGIVGMKAHVVDSGDSNREDTVRIAVEVALVVRPTAVTAGKHEDRAFACSAVLDTVHHSLPDQIVRALHGSATIWGTPTAGVDRRILVVVVQGRCFIDIGNRSGQNTDTGDLGFVCNTDSAHIVLDCGYLSPASRTMVVVVLNGSG